MLDALQNKKMFSTTIKLEISDKSKMTKKEPMK